MRLWSIHPRYLDAQGLVALWREALLAQAVLAGLTRGYTRHPQLTRFRETTNPRGQIAAYLESIHAEAARRGYHFDGKKINRCGKTRLLTVTRGQLDYEWRHLARKLVIRNHAHFLQIKGIRRPKPHPLFRVIAGEVSPTERIKPGLLSVARRPAKPRR